QPEISRDKMSSHHPGTCIFPGQPVYGFSRGKAVIFYTIYNQFSPDLMKEQRFLFIIPEEIIGRYTPFSPLPDHSFRKVFHNPEFFAREISENLCNYGKQKIPVQKHPQSPGTFPEFPVS